MINALRAEFRKVATTSLWWALLIPSVALALAAALFTGWAGDMFTDLFESEASSAAGQHETAQIPWTVFAFARSINIATVLPLVLGALAVSGEYSRRTLTTTFLTTPNRGSAFGAKILNYILWGAIYGVAIVLTVSAGIAVTADAGALPQAGSWLAMAGVGILASILMALFGVAAGALIRNAAATLVILLLYFLLIENGVVYVLLEYARGVVGFLPNASINGLTGALATNIFLSAIPPLQQQDVMLPPNQMDVEGFLQSVAGAQGAFEWWLSGLIFLGWITLVFGAAWALTRRRDIT